MTYYGVLPVYTTVKHLEAMINAVQNVVHAELAAIVADIMWYIMGIWYPSLDRIHCQLDLCSLICSFLPSMILVKHLKVFHHITLKDSQLCSWQFFHIPADSPLFYHLEPHLSMFMNQSHFISATNNTICSAQLFCEPTWGLPPRGIHLFNVTMVP